jgi:hypothetical protein
MPTKATFSGSFVKNTRARAADMNAALNTITGSFANGTYDLYATGYRINRTTPVVNTTLTGNDAFMCAFYKFDTGTTFDLATSTARFACIGTLEALSGSTFHIAAGAVAKII